MTAINTYLVHWPAFHIARSAVICIDPSMPRDYVIAIWLDGQGSICQLCDVLEPHGHLPLELWDIVPGTTRLEPVNAPPPITPSTRSGAGYFDRILN